MAIQTIHNVNLRQAVIRAYWMCQLLEAMDSRCTYGQMAKALGIHHRNVNIVLGEVNRVYATAGTMITGRVGNKNTGKAGSGYNVCAKDLGLRTEQGT